jgi:hypothetical protein
MFELEVSTQFILWLNELQLNKHVSIEVNIGIGSNGILTSADYYIKNPT